MIENAPVAQSLCDFGRSFLQFTTSRTPHIPRLRVKAICSLQRPGQAPRTFVLAGTCMSENTYRPSGLVQLPPSTFMLISDGQEFLVHKRHADATLDLRQAGRVGDVMKTHDGRGATIEWIKIGIQSLKATRQLTGFGEIRDAIIANRVLTGVTRYELAPSEGGALQVRLEYPIDVCNVRHDQDGWQMDTGPMLMPRPAHSSRQNLIEQLTPAFILFNASDWAECAILESTPLQSSAPVPATSHYSRVVRLDHVHNEIHCEG
jgi:hypothetical protein